MVKKMKSEIQTVDLNNIVEVHLPDGSILAGPRGTPAVEFLQKIAPSQPGPIVAAIVNGDLRELTYPIKMESNLTPVTMVDADGARIYRRSLTFLLETAFVALFPQATLI